MKPERVRHLAISHADNEGFVLTFFMKDRPDSVCCFATPLDILRQRRPTKIKVAVLQAHLFVCLIPYS